LPFFPPWLARVARFTVLVLVGFLLLWAAAWKGWFLRSDRQYLPRNPDPRRIAVPAGYRAEVLAWGLNAPSALEVAPDGSIYIGESGYGGAYAATAGVEGATPGRILRLNQDGTLTVVAGNFLPPLGGFVHDAKGDLFVSHNGVVTAITPQGRRDIVTGLPSLGDHKNNNIALGPDGQLYLAQGTVTNSGIVGLDNWVLWGRFFPGPRDIPCQDVTLRGVNRTTADPRSILPFMRVATGAYSPFGHTTKAGQVVRGQVPCNGSILRFGPDGSGMDLVAWGLRNPFDLRFSKSGDLYVTDQGPDTRGSRPFQGPDLLYRIRSRAWYGWPDYWNGQPVSTLNTAGRERPQMLLARVPGQPEPAFAALGQHVAAVGFDFAPASFGFEGQLFIAQWGTAFPATTQYPDLVGFNIARFDAATRRKEIFATNVKPGPASLSPDRGGFERPVAVRFGSDGAMYILDWGHLSVTRKGPYHVPDSGVLWRISRTDHTALPSYASAAARPPLQRSPASIGQNGAERSWDPRPAVAMAAVAAAGWLLWRGRREADRDAPR